MAYAYIHESSAAFPAIYSPLIPAKAGTQTSLFCNAFRVTVFACGETGMTTN